MDEISFLVEETLQLSFLKEVDQIEECREKVVQIPEAKTQEGLIYHIQQSASVVIIRSFCSQDIAKDYENMMNHPEMYPSLRLAQIDQNIEKLKFIPMSYAHAEFINNSVHNQRYPLDEEQICNISDQGYSWWLVPREDGFEVVTRIIHGTSDEVVKLGPLGDRSTAQNFLKKFGAFFQEQNLSLSLIVEPHRFRFTVPDEGLKEELIQLFEYGEIGPDIESLFGLLAKANKETELESVWFYLNELAAMRRFWIQVCYDISSERF